VKANSNAETGWSSLPNLPDRVVTSHGVARVSDAQQPVGEFLIIQGGVVVNDGGGVKSLLGRTSAAPELPRRNARISVTMATRRKSVMLQGK
jgi:hypothetical protein